MGDDVLRDRISALEETERFLRDTPWIQENATLKAQLQQQAAALATAERIGMNMHIQIKYMIDEITKALKLEGDWSPADVVTAVRELVPMIERLDETKQQLSDAQATIQRMDDRLAAMDARLEPGEIWSLFRRVLEQGGAIQQDYAAGKYPSYEYYSARLDEAARERADAFLQALAPAPGGQK